MSSEYGVKIHQVLNKTLGMLGQRGISKRISTDPLIPTLGVDVGMLAYNPVGVATLGTTGAITTFQWTVVGRGGSNNPVTLQPLVSQNDDLETLIFGWRIDLALSALADAANLKWLNYYRVRVMGEDSAMQTVREAYCQRWGYYDWANGKIHLIISNAPSMSLNQGGGQTIPTVHQEDKPIWVPAGTTLQMCVDIDPVANFAVNATFDVEAWGVTFPKGMRGPFM